MSDEYNNPLTAVGEFIKITTLLSTERNLRRLLDTIVTSARKIANADAGVVSLLDTTKRNLYVEVFQNDSVNVRKRDYPMVPLVINGQRNETNISIYSTFSGKTINVDDVYKYSGFDFSDVYEFDKVTGYRTKSLLTVPLVNHKEITVGVLQLINAMATENGKIVSFSEPMEKIVSAFASQAAVAIDNVQLINENARLIQVLNQTTENLELENRRLRNKIGSDYDFSRIIGDGPGIRNVFSLIEKVVDSDVTVLIRGETGTGKELVAHAIHDNGIRRDKEFVAQNCAALPENLLESELFGYKKGAFSGAAADKKGLIEQANGGTLFLDEIGDMPLGLQAKLLRILQEKEVRPLGAVRSIKVNVRIVAATHCDLAKKVAEGAFRQDLYYRLSVFPIELPSLRTRTEDLPALVKHFLDSFMRKYNKKIKGISPLALESLMHYSYPGNIRELRNILERAVLLCEEGASIMPEHFPPDVLDSDDTYKPAVVRRLQAGGLREMVEAYEASVIQDKLREFNGNQTRTAEDLQVARRTLIEKINRYGIARVVQEA